MVRAHADASLGIQEGHRRISEHSPDQRDSLLRDKGQRGRRSGKLVAGEPVQGAQRLPESFHDIPLIQLELRAEQSGESGRCPVGRGCAVRSIGEGGVAAPRAPVYWRPTTAGGRKKR